MSVELNRSTIPSVCWWYGEVRISLIPTVSQNCRIVLDMKLDPLSDNSSSGTQTRAESARHSTTALAVAFLRG